MQYSSHEPLGLILGSYFLKILGKSIPNKYTNSF